MSSSDFLPFQDINGDGLNDACKDEIKIAEPKYCPECVPRPAALIPNWRDKKRYDPFLNEKNCKYQVTLTTNEDTTGWEEGFTEEQAQEALSNIYKNYEDDAILALLNAYGKDNSEGSIEFVKEYIEHTDFWLDTRPKTRLKLLYSVPHAILSAVDSAAGEEDEEEEPEDIVVTYVASEMEPTMLRIRKGLHLYNRYLKVLRAVDESNILFLEDNRVFNLQNYGDFVGLFGDSVLSDILPQLDVFLNKHGYNIPRGDFKDIRLFFSRDTVTEITFTFTPEYVLKKLKFHTETCKSKPIILINVLSDLNSQSAWKDKTAVAYFAKLKEMDTDLTARTPKLWSEFIIEHTYPEVYMTNTVAYYEETAASCVAEALSGEVKQLGQDILDEVFSLGDAIAYKFSDQVCKATLGEELDEKVKFGIIIDPNVVDDPGTLTVNESEKHITTMALEQAFASLEQSEQVFVPLCAKLLMMGGIGGTNSEDLLNKLWEGGLDDIKVCGLFDLLMEAVTCLLGGLTLEEALAKMIESALRAMSINSFGQLFVGLSKEKQDELDELVKKNLAEGDIFHEGSSAQQLSDVVAGESTATDALKEEGYEIWPWANEEASEAEQDAPSATADVPPPEETEEQVDSQNDLRTLAQQYDSAGSDLDSKHIMDAYILALIEVYQENLLGLADELNKFPGAQLISSILVTLDCPRPGKALFNPSIMEWIHDYELPFCRNIDDIEWPKLRDPQWWLPSVKDLLYFLWQAIRWAIQQLFLKIMTMLFIKICELIGNAVCNALEAVGDVLASLPDLLTGRDNLRNVIKDSICGEDADDQAIDDTIVDMMASLGVGGAALANPEEALAFAGDMSASLTQTELINAFLGNPSKMALDLLDSLIEYEYPNYRDAIPNRQAVESFFSNMGNLMPADFRAGMQDYVNQLPEGDESPANPSICIDPEKMERFCELRMQILEGRASPEQRAALCDSSTNQSLEDLGDLSTILQGGLGDYIESNMPPLVSDPGCDNGLVPFEPAVTIDLVTSGIGNDLEMLKVDYSTDMIGNGPGEDNWGLINMMLSDTMGTPLTAHYRKSANRPMYVDFYGTWNPDRLFAASLMSASPLLFLSLRRFMLQYQRGAYPTKVAAYLQNEMTTIAGSTEMHLNNEWTPDHTWTMSLDNLGFRNLPGRGGTVDLLALPDLRYNVDFDVTIDDQGDIDGVRFVRKGRKRTPDISLSYEDNAKGLKATEESVYSYGFDIKAFFGDLEQNEEGDVVNRLDDNVRILIEDRHNMGANLDTSMAGAYTPEVNEEGESTTETLSIMKRSDAIQTSLKYEFMAVDNTLSRNQDMIEAYQNYPGFLRTFQAEQSYTPQTILLKEILNSENDASLQTADIKTFREEVLQNILNTMFSDVAADETSWAYGAKYDDLTKEDLDYGVVTGAGSFVLYSETDYVNDDMVLGVSRMQYEVDNGLTETANRVFYLDPMKFGGNYMNPPLYIKPLRPEGWLGMVDVLFPELSPCKPQTTDLVDFGQIQDMINDLYPTIPEDERLKSDPDCIKELPYNRILDRSAKAAMAGLIMAAIRIYVSVHFIKTMPTFTKFAPKFPMVFSSAYASYIVEDMKKSFKDAQGAFWEVFNTFKDEEFWYAFLEQSVQLYGMRVDSGEIEPPAEVLEALFRLNDMQEEYDYPYRDDLVDAKKLGEAEFLQTLKSYRAEKNLEAVRLTEEDAKLVMKELVIEQLNYMAVKFMKNLRRLELSPEIKDLDYYLLENMVAGDEQLTLNSALKPDGSFTATYAGLPTLPFEENEEAEEPYYTSGGEFVVTEDNDGVFFGVGDEYIGYYNVTLDEESGDIVFMAGEYYLEDELQDVLRPVAGIITVPIGDVPDIGAVLAASASTEQPFILEKYISVGEERMTPDSAVAEIQSNSDLTKLISEIYPGPDSDPMRLVEDEDGNVVGIEGQLGVRHGISLSVAINGISYEITSVEIDALDLPLSNFVSIKANSKLLLCLINNLKEDSVFRLVSRYIFPLNKLTALIAIYNDMAMLPSIGELTVGDGETYVKGIVDIDVSKKPGLQATPNLSEPVDGRITVQSVTVAPMDGYDPDFDGAWASVKDRDPGMGGWGVREWDNWDQELLQNSTARIKKLFKAYYNTRDFTPSDITKSSDGPGAIVAKKLRDALRPRPGRQLVPWWQRLKLRTNPFNANDELCENKD